MHLWVDSCYHSLLRGAVSELQQKERMAFMCCLLLTWGTINVISCESWLSVLTRRKEHVKMLQFCCSAKVRWKFLLVSREKPGILFFSQLTRIYTTESLTLFFSYPLQYFFMADWLQRVSLHSSAFFRGILNLWDSSLVRGDLCFILTRWNEISPMYTEMTRTFLQEI